MASERDPWYLKHFSKEIAESISTYSPSVSAEVRRNVMRLPGLG